MSGSMVCRGRIPRLEAVQVPGTERPGATSFIAGTGPVRHGGPGRVLGTTEQAIGRIIQEARVVADPEIDQLTTWRDRMTPPAQEVRGVLTDLQARTLKVDQRMRAALEPMTSSMG